MRTTISIGDAEPARYRVRIVDGARMQARVDLEDHAALLALMDEL